ncbi:MAG TPA: MDR family MFS transporter, partial [Thermomicrobiaceae bacterium]|nr:MDR family MFS transporter [Thermomicrobiaceae bacterium]
MRPSNNRLIVVAVLLATFLSALDTSIIGTAMPTVIGQLGGLALYSWVFSAYLLTSTTAVPIYGRLADLYGRKPLAFSAIALFLLGSALCGLARNMPELVAFRALQGLGAGGIIPITMTILGDLFAAEDLAKVQGLTSAVWGSSAIAGPTVGGFIVAYVGWRWVFYVNLPFGLAAAALLWLFFHEQVERRPHRIDYLGALTMTLSITSLLLALLRVGQDRAWLDPTVIGPFVLAVLLLGWFLWNEAHAPEPMLPLGLFRLRVISVVFPANVLIGAAMFGVTSYLPLFVQGVLGGSAIDAGLVLAPYSVCWSLASVLSGRLLLRFGYFVSAVTGFVVMLAGALLLQLVPGSQTLWPSVVSAAVFGCGMGLSATAFIIAAQNAVGWGERGTATASVMFGRTIGGAIGVAALGTVLSAAMAPRLASLGGHYDANALLDPAARAALAPDVLRAIQTALQHGLQLAYLGVLGGVVLAVLV